MTFRGSPVYGYKREGPFYYRTRAFKLDGGVVGLGFPAFRYPLCGYWADAGHKQQILQACGIDLHRIDLGMMLRIDIFGVFIYVKIATLFITEIIRCKTVSAVEVIHLVQSEFPHERCGLA